VWLTLKNFGCGRMVRDCNKGHVCNNGEAEWYLVSEGFQVKVGVHQGSVLSPLLFITVLQALSRMFRRGLPMELLYADDLILLADSEDLLVEKIKMWKVGMEKKGLRLNMGKTKVMRCCNGAGQGLKSGKYPCGVCSKGVGSNSVECISCPAQEMFWHLRQIA